MITTHNTLPHFPPIKFSPSIHPCLPFSSRSQLRNPPLQLGHLPQLNLQILPFVLQRQSLICIQLGEHKVALPIKLQDPRVILPQTPAMGDRHQGNTQSLGIVVHDLLRLERDGRGTLVQDSVPWLVVEETGHGDALLEAAGQDITPLGLGVPAFGVQLEKVLEVEGLEDLEQLGVGDALGAHRADAVRVDDLLAQRAAREVGALRDVKDVGEGRLVDGAAVDGPETAEDAEQGRLAAAVGADDEQVIALLEGEGEGLDEDVTVGGDDRAGVCVSKISEES